jgi:D-ribose pyranose/furanose isomerase RbsD
MFIVKSVPHLLPLVEVISEEVPVERLVLAEL